MEVSSLREALFEEIYATLGIGGRRWAHRLLRPLLSGAATRFARIATAFEDSIERIGFHQAMRRVLPNFVTGFQAQGVEHVPERGPLLVVSNHPGTFDSLVIAASVPRDDLSIVSKDFPFLRLLPRTSRHLIYSTSDTFDRMAVARAAIRHLQAEGALLIFPSGHLDPDPDFMPGALEELGGWSRSLELFLHRVPQTRVLVTIVSGTMKSAFVNSPLLRFWKERLDRQKVAEVFQVARQMILPYRLKLTPRVTFNPPLSFEESFPNGQLQDALDAIIGKARESLSRHLASWGIGLGASG